MVVIAGAEQRMGWLTCLATTTCIVFHLPQTTLYCSDIKTLNMKGFVFTLRLRDTVNPTCTLSIIFHD